MSLTQSPWVVGSTALSKVFPGKRHPAPPPAAMKLPSSGISEKYTISEPPDGVAIMKLAQQDDAPALNNVLGAGVGVLTNSEGKGDYEGQIKNGVPHGIGNMRSAPGLSVFVLGSDIRQLKLHLLQLDRLFNNRHLSSSRSPGKKVTALLNAIEKLEKKLATPSTLKVYDCKAFEDLYITYLETLLTNHSKRSNLTGVDHRELGGIADRLALFYKGDPNKHFEAISIKGNAYGGQVNELKQPHGYGVLYNTSPFDASKSIPFTGRLDSGKVTNDGRFDICRDDIMKRAREMATEAGQTPPKTGRYSSMNPLHMRSKFRQVYNALVKELDDGGTPTAMLTKNEYDKILPFFRAFEVDCVRKSEKQPGTP